VALALRIDPWASEYESTLQLDEEPDDRAPEIPIRTDPIADQRRR